MPFSRFVPSYLLSELRHVHFFNGYNTRSRDLLHPPFTKTAKYQESFIINGTQTFNTLSRNFRQVKMLRDLKSSQSAILNSHACGTCCLYILNIYLVFNVLMSLFLRCVRAPFELSILNWMPPGLINE